MMSLDALHGHLFDEILADHGVHQGTRACGQLVEARARHGVAGEYHRCSVEFDPESDSRLDWSVIGRSRGDPHAVAGPHHALGDFFHLDGGWFGDVGMMADPIADVRGQRVERRVDDRRGSGWTDHRSGVRVKVVTHRVVMTSERSVMWSLCRCVRSRAEMLAAPTPTAAARINVPRPQSTRNVCAAGPHEGRGSGAVGVDNGTACTEKGDLDHEA